MNTKHFFSPLTIKRINKFKKLKRGYYSLWIIIILYFLSFLSEFIINGNPIIVKYNDKIYWTLYNSVRLRQDIFKKAGELYSEYNTFKDKFEALPEKEKLKHKTELINLENNYIDALNIRLSFKSQRKLNKEFKKQNSGNWLIMPLYPYGPNEILLDELQGQAPPTAPSKQNFFGTDDRGRDVFARMVYGFRISITFALLLVLSTYIIGITIGAVLGYYGGKIDFFGLRIIEIWSAIPFLYTVMIITSITSTNMPLLIIILSIFGWMGMTFYIRGEFLREKQKEYTLAAKAIGVKDINIIFKHIMPNSLTPAIAFLPFSVVGGISSLVSLDFLGFGLPEPTSSWGQMLGQGVSNLNSWWLTAAPVLSIFFTLLLITFIGEAVREAFDPKEYAKLR